MPIKTKHLPNKTKRLPNKTKRLPNTFLKHDTKKYISQQQSPHNGEMLQARIKKRRISKAAVLRALQRVPETFYSFTKKHSLQTEILWQICMVMKHNFFADLAAELPKDFTTYVAVDTSKDE